MNVKKTGIFLALALLIGAGSMFVAGCRKDNRSAGTAGNASGSAEPSGEIRFSWWGNETRNQATINAIRAYEAKHPGVKIVPEYSAVDGYNTKLLTQISGGNAPDIFTFSAEALTTMVETGGCEDLTGKVDVSTHNPMVVNACSLNGKMYGVNLAINANVIYYNKTQADELGINMPADSYTWDDLVAIAAEVYQKSGGKTYGFPDLRMVKPMETTIPAWNMTHNGKEPPFPWTDKEMIIKGTDVAAFMDYFSKAPQGVLLPPDETATLSSVVDVPIASRKTFFALDYSGTFGMYQSQTKDLLDMIEYPHNGKGKGAAVSARPGLIESVYSKSKNKALAIDFLNWIANDPEAGLILKSVRGVLPSSRQVEAVLANPDALSDVDKKIFSITNKIYSGNVNPFSPGIAGVSDIWNETHLLSVGAEVAFGRITPEQAGQRFDTMLEDLVPRR